VVAESRFECGKASFLDVDHQDDGTALGTRPGEQVDFGEIVGGQQAPPRRLQPLGGHGVAGLEPDVAKDDVAAGMCVAGDFYGLELEDPPVIGSGRGAGERQRGQCEKQAQNWAVWADELHGTISMRKCYATHGDLSRHYIAINNNELWA